MISIICKRIDNGTPEGGQGAYCADLLKYMLNPETKEGVEEKCVAYMGKNFSRPDLDAEEMAAEMAGDCALSKRVDQGVDHWVLSFKKDAADELKPDQIFKAVDQWVDDMGYGEKDAHKWTAAIHTDTDNIHVHISVCRINALTGKAKARGYWKLDNQKALARMAKEQGWKLEAGSQKYKCRVTDKPDVETRIDPITGEETRVIRPHVDMGDGGKAISEIFFKTLDKGKGGSPSPYMSAAFKWPAPKNPPDEVDRVIALLKTGKYPGLPVTKEIGEELERRGVPVNHVSQKEWEDSARRLDYRIQKNGIKDEALNMVNDKNVEVMKRNGAELWGKHRRKEFKPSDKAARREHYSGVKSDLRLLHERLDEAYREMEPELKNMKWGQIHAALAEHGIEMQLREHGDRKGLVFSLDGETWAPASRVCPQMTWGALNGNIGAKKDSWRDMRSQTRETLEARRKEERKPEAATSTPEPEDIEMETMDEIIAGALERARRDMDLLEPMPATEKKLTFDGLSKAQVYALRDIDTETAREALKAGGIELKEAKGKRIRTAIDVAMYEGGLAYHDAAVKLAELFPDVAKLGTEQEGNQYQKILDMAKAEILAKGGKWTDYERGTMGDRCGREMVKWWQALQLDRIDIHTNTHAASEANQERTFTTSDGRERSGIPPCNKDGATLADLLAARPQLMAISAAGDHSAPPHLFCAPHWRDGRVGIMLDDVKRPFLKIFRPNAIVHTSSESRQAFYLLDRKYEPEFYDVFMAHVNEAYGDGKIDKTGWDTRLPGLFNQKRDKTLFNKKTGEHDELVKIEWSSTAYPKNFAGFVDDYHAAWIRQGGLLDQQAGAEAKAEGKPAPAKPRQTAGRPASRNYETIKSDDPKFQAVYNQLKKVELPKWLEDIGMDSRQYLIDTFTAQGLDRSRVDSGVARALYQAGANPDEVYTFFTRHLAQRELPGKERIDSDKTADRQARRLATNLAPAWMSEGGWRAVKESSGQPQQRDEAFYQNRIAEINKIRAQNEQRQGSGQGQSQRQKQ